MKLLCIISILIILFLGGILNAQPTNNYNKTVVVPAPNAATLGNYGEIENNSFTGVPNISVPIDIIKEGDLEIGLSLSFNASGSRISEPSSWVGMNWSLQGQGMISRTVLGLYDESIPGYYNTGDLLEPVDLLLVSSGLLDSEPDLFSFSIPGYSGKFIIDKNHEVRLIPLQNLKITYSYNAENFCFDWFLITTPDGKKNYFGNLPNTITNVGIEKTIIKETPTGNGAGPWVEFTTTWHQVALISADEKYSILFDYQSENYSYTNLSTCNYSILWCEYYGTGEHITTGCSGIYDALLNKYLDRTNISGKRLKTISTPTKVISFLATTNREDIDQPTFPSGSNNGMKLLNRIEIVEGENTKKIDFSCDYFLDTQVPNRSEYKRLKLNEITISGWKNGILNDIGEKYSFEYQGSLNNNGTHFFPNRLTRATDHWGYYNGATSNNNGSGIKVNIPPTTVPYLQGSYSHGNSNRETSESSMIIGSLKKIIYPTGGNTEFEFEANDYPKTETLITPLITGLENCYPLNPSCCDNTTNSTSISFSQQDILNGQFLMRLWAADLDWDVPPYSCYSGSSQSLNVSMQITISDGVNNFFKSFNFNAAHGAYNELSGSLSSFVNANGLVIQPNINYTVYLTVTNGRGVFDLNNVNNNHLVNKKVGGLRVKKIKNVTGLSIKETHFAYTQESSPLSSGNLFIAPKYSGAMLGYNGAAIVFQDAPMVSLSTFEGIQIGYSRIVYWENGQGFTVKKFNILPINQGNTYPFTPPIANAKNGSVHKNLIFNQNSNLISSKETQYLYPDPPYYIQGPIFKVKRYDLNECSSGGSAISNIFLVSVYQPEYQYLMPKQTIEYKDGLEKITNLEYSPTKHLFPISETTINSDGIENRTEYTYNTDYPTSINGVSTLAIKNALVNRNIIASPWKTVKKVNGVIVDAMETEYALFRLTTGLPNTTNPNISFPRVHKIKKLENTWNENGVMTGGALRTVATFTNYDAFGNPKTVDSPGWASEIYEWEPSGVLKKRTFQGFVWNYAYYPGTRLLQSITEPDGQVKSFEYDALSRLIKIRERGDNVITDFDYHFKTTANPHNFIKTKVSFTPVAGSDFHNKEVFEYFDGLGRTIQTVQVKATPDQKDLVSVVQYDNVGRVSKQFNPFTTTQNSGAYVAILPSATKFTLTTYEPNPLNRVASVTPPNWYATTTTYGTNANDAVINHKTGSNYPDNFLFKQTVVDPNGNKSVNFTDKLGRMVLERKTTAANTNFADTYFLYDDKDRVAKVLPPGSALTSSELIFTYLYDERDRLIRKKVPSQAQIETVYNERNLPIYMKDGNLGASGNWIHTWYDLYGRPLRAGLFNGAPAGEDQTLLQIYTQTVYGTAGIELGKVKRQRTNILGANTLMDTYFNYDAYGRVTYSNGDNHLGTALGDMAEQATNVYDFADNLISVNRIHKIGTATTNTTYNLLHTKTYDHQGRIKDVALKIDNNPSQIISFSNYDFRGRMNEKNLHKNTAGGFLQNVNYSYNEQNWLTAINQLNCMGIPAFAEKTSSFQNLEVTIDISVPTEGDSTNTNSDKDIWVRINLMASQVKENGASELINQTQIIKGVFDTLQQFHVFTLETSLPPIVTLDKSIHLRYPQEVRVDNIANFYLTLRDDFVIEAKQQGIEEGLAENLGGKVQAMMEQVLPVAARINGDEPLPGGTPPPYSGDLFALLLNYNDGNTALQAPIQRNGNISAMTWQVACRNPQQYGFQYDYLDRLTKSTYAEIQKTNWDLININNYNTDEIKYDLRGNITDLNRRGCIPNNNGTSWIYDKIDELNYGYSPGTNRLATVEELEEKAHGFKSQLPTGIQTGLYGYDLNGNVISDQHKEITAITYNHLNLPTLISLTNGRSIAFTYDATGKKLTKTTSVNGTIQDRRDYIGGIEYTGTTNGNRTLEAIYHDEGRVSYDNSRIPVWQWEYSLRDHLGNSRVNFKADPFKTGATDKANENDIIQENSYYAFGMAMDQPFGYGTQGVDNRYKYNGKELVGDFGLDWMDYGARWYDAGLGRWGAVDPLAEKAPNQTPYRYGFNNPILFIDPDGRFEEPPVNGLPYFGDDSGDYYWNEAKQSYDHHNKKTGDYIGQFQLDMGETYEPVGDYRISFYHYNGDESPENNAYDISKTPLAAATYMLYLSEQGDLKSLSDESKYPGVKIYSSPHTEGGVTLGNVIFVNEGYYKNSQLENGRNSLLEHEYGHYLDYKYHFKYNFGSYVNHIGLPSIRSAAGWGPYGYDHSKNPVERKADILSTAYFRRF